MSAPALTFLGATGTVTGSRFLVSTNDTRVLVDCGLYQGVRELRRRNWLPFPVEPGSIDAVLLTHAHLDHCGYLPALVRQGFTGPVVCTPDTAALVAIVLRDSARLQEEDAAFAAEGGFSKHRPPLPLYDSTDAERAIALLQPQEFHCSAYVAEGVRARFEPAGHVLGSAVVSVEAGDRRLLFSGDLGRGRHPLLTGPGPAPAADVVVVESTYGARPHPAVDTGRFADALRRTLGRAGVVVIPAFAVDRTELVLHAIRELMVSGAVPRAPVCVDSPMALAALEVYRRAIIERHADVRPSVALDGDTFDPGDLREARTREESTALDARGGPMIIVSASGMATGGRVVHHLARYLGDPRHCVVLVGFQTAGTRGRDLAEGARRLRIHGQWVPVRAEVVSVTDFSVHADGGEVVDWLGTMPAPPQRCFVVHGGPDAAQAVVDLVGRRLQFPCAVAEDMQTWSLV